MAVWEKTKFMFLRTTLVVATTVLGIAVSSPTPLLAQTPIPASAWGREPAMGSVTLSPDGRHLAALVSLDGNRRQVMIWDTDNVEAPPSVVTSDEREEIVSVNFIKNDRIFVTTQQWSDYLGGGRVRAGYVSRTRLIDLEGNVMPIPEFPGQASTADGIAAARGLGRLVSSLQNHPTDILVEPSGNGDVFRYNTSNGSFSRVRRGSDQFGGTTTDLSGEIRARSEFDFDGGAAYIAQWVRRPATNEWVEVFRSYARDRDPLSIVAFTNDPDIILVSGARGRDRVAIWEYNVATRSFADEPAFAHPLFDAQSVIQSSSPADFGEVIGFTYQADRPTTYWLDPQLDQIQTQMRAALSVEMAPVSWVDITSGRRVRFEAPVDADVRVLDSSQDRSVVAFVRSGPGQPPEYYLMANGRARLLGRAYPDININLLGETRLIQYAARDGLMIPAFLTTPDPARFGEGPYPTIITPHGGPWARDDMGWDPTGWTQYFASRGYAVLQPQFRGSDGWGQRLWRAGDNEWGGRMQDDLDDGVRYLIEQRVAAPDRVAMHGYSYGGYASMMAAVRPNGLYQCAIAGAGPASMNEFRQDTYDSRYLREFQHPSATGVDPIAHVQDVSIPVYLYSGDNDSTVYPHESEAFANALRGAGKDVTLRILPRMQHGLGTWTPENIQTVLTTVEDFIRTECGPDGL